MSATRERQWRTTSNPIHPSGARETGRAHRGDGAGVEHSRPSIRERSPARILILPALVLALLAAALSFLDTSPDERIPRDADLCPTDRETIAGSAMFLFDFTKPLDAEQAALPGRLLRQVSDGLARDVELQVFSLTGSTAAPRALLRRLCKPFDREAPQAAGEGGNPGGSDCAGSVPASGTAPGESARFCAVRDALEEKLNAMADREWPEDQRVANAYLVEAIEDTRLDFAERPEPHLLYVFSDMMQHAPWYSHLETAGNVWRFDEFAESLKSHSWMSGQPDGFEDTQVELFYVPRIGTTEAADARRSHQDFWHSYFGDALSAMHDQPPMGGYRSAPLTNASAAAQIAGQDRAAIERQILEIRREGETLASEMQDPGGGTATAGGGAGPAAGGTAGGTRAPAHGGGRTAAPGGGRAQQSGNGNGDARTTGSAPH